MEDLIATSMHQIWTDKTNNRLVCLNCKSSRHKSSEATKAWLSASCSGPLISSPVPVRFPMQLQIGNQITHATHQLHNMRGVIFCMRCGYMSGGTSIKSLVKPCEHIERTARRAHGQRVIDQLSRGIMPESIRRHFGAWPEERSSASCA